mgnify:CR=1 FL=1|jgi:hypothetical protein
MAKRSPKPSRTPKRTPSRAKARKASPAKSRVASYRPGDGSDAADQVLRTRELFWHNVVQEVLTALSVLHAKRTEGDTGGSGGDIFDGRIAVITAQGARVPIGSVQPLFACGVMTSTESRALSAEVECTVFQIETPEGQAFTLPLHEIRAVHALSPDLMEQIRQATAEGDGEGEGESSMPFGFAAFTSLARARREAAGQLPAPSIVGPGLPE